MFESTSLNMSISRKSQSGALCSKIVWTRKSSTKNAGGVHPIYIYEYITNHSMEILIIETYYEVFHWMRGSEFNGEYIYIYIYKCGYGSKLGTPISRWLIHVNTKPKN